MEELHLKPYQLLCSPMMVVLLVEIREGGGALVPGAGASIHWFGNE
jgi:hypothetical protein